MTVTTAENAKPLLTYTRWVALTSLRRHPHLLRREFLPRELMLKAPNWNNGRRASGPTLHSLFEAGWVSKVETPDGEPMPFRTGKPPISWVLTPEGREAVEKCPDTFPAQSVYEQEPTT